MRRWIRNFLRAGGRFKKEFRKELRLLISFTFGFTIAFTWRQTIFDLSQEFINFILDVNSAASTILTSVFITLLSILLIILSSKVLKEEQ